MIYGLAARGDDEPGRQRQRFAIARKQQIEKPFLDALFGDLLHFILAIRAYHVYRDVSEVPDHRLHISADVAHFRELRCLDLDERRAGEPGQPPGDLGLSDSRRADHYNVVRHDLVPELLRDLLPPPAVAQSDGDRLLRSILGNHVLIQLGHDLTRRQLILRHGAGTRRFLFSAIGGK